MRRTSSRCIRTGRAALVAAGVVAVFVASCADPALQLAAEQAIARAAKAETEAEALEPSRNEALTYRMPLKQAREALAGGDERNAELMADKAYEAAVDVRDRRMGAKQQVTVRL